MKLFLLSVIIPIVMTTTNKIDIYEYLSINLDSSQFAVEYKGIQDKVFFPLIFFLKKNQKQSFYADTDNFNYFIPISRKEFNKLVQFPYIKERLLSGKILDINKVDSYFSFSFSNKRKKLQFHSGIKESCFILSNIYEIIIDESNKQLVHQLGKRVQCGWVENY